MNDNSPDGDPSSIAAENCLINNIHPETHQLHEQVKERATEREEKEEKR